MFKGGPLAIGQAETLASPPLGNVLTPLCVSTSQCNKTYTIVDLTNVLWAFAQNDLIFMCSTDIILSCCKNHLHRHI
jgi:hypothetical protein